MTYEEARKEAQDKANAHRMDYGVEELGGPLAKGFRCFMLPRPEKRQGHELRCEVVRPETPAPARAGGAE